MDSNNGLIYLDYAATTPVDPRVLEAMLPYFSEKYFNSSGVYGPGQECRSALDAARQKVADALGCRPAEIVFTSGGTESDNAAIGGIAMTLRGETKHIITSMIEHHAVLHRCHAMEKQGFEVTYLPVDGDGLLDLEELERAIRPETSLVTIMLANNEIGTIQSLAEMARIVKAKARSLRTQIAFHTDAVQGAAYLDLDVDRLGIDALSLSAHKFNGPKGVGILYLRRATPFDPQQLGGSQERNRRAGTENVPGIVGAAMALQIAAEGREANAKKVAALRERLINGIEERIPRARLNGHRTQRLPNNVNYSFEDTDSQWTLMALDQAGIAVSTGSACNTASLDPSHVLTATGVPANLALGTLRLTLGASNTIEQVDRVLDTLPGVIEQVRATAPQGAAT
jgi:cysteine desulfurase